jgi:hypothetical protein
MPTVSYLTGGREGRDEKKGHLRCPFVVCCCVFCFTLARALVGVAVCISEMTESLRVFQVIM